MTETTVAIAAVPPFDGRIDAELLTGAVRAAVETARRDPSPPPDSVETGGRSVDVSVRITDDEEMRALNRTYRNVDKTTDVLSFSFVSEAQGPAVEYPSDWSLDLGEIVISLPCAARQAVDLGHSLSTELAWLTIHGTLQLLGYAHAEEDEAEHMESLEQDALSALGLSP